MQRIAERPPGSGRQRRRGRENILTQEDNELMTRVGPGPPAGELLRRYWHPVAVAQELTDENPTRFVPARRGSGLVPG